MNPGDIVAQRFAIEHLAGSGGMGSVYRARDLQEGGDVALKLLRFGAKELGARFAREAQVLSELDHPAVVRYIAHGATRDGVPYLAMEWLEGVDLAKLLLKGPLSISKSLAIAARIAQGLAIAHARDIVHRDIKPSNLFLEGGDVERAKLLDFGVARLGPSTSLTRTGIAIGTPGYMSPEQARGAPTVDARADVYGLGCVLFKCVTGATPFVGENVVAVLGKVLLEEPRRASELRPDVPLELDDLIARMLSKDPAARPAHGAALVAELTSLQKHLESQCAPMSRMTALPTVLTGGEQRLVSVVVVAPVQGSRETEATLSQEEWAHRQERTLGLAAVVAPFGGRLETLANGSVVVALSGQGSATDLATQAARCALAIRAELPAVPMALATGRGVMAGRVPVGDALDRAASSLRDPRDRRAPARVDGPSSTRREPVSLDDVTAGLLDASFLVTAYDDGLGLLGERDALEAPRTLLGRATPFVGRNRELGMLRVTYDEVWHESVARAVLVTGAAGIGKSRLRSEFVHELRHHESAPQVWIARGEPRSAGSPFGMLSQAVRRTAGIVDGEAASARYRKMRARLGRHLHGEDAERVSEFVGELAGAPSSRNASVQLRAAREDRVLMGDQMLRAWQDFLAAECAAGPVVLVLENLHWGDLPTVMFIDGALRALHDKPLLVLAFARTEVFQLFPRLWADRAMHKMSLTELTRKACEKLVHHTLGDVVDPGTVAGLAERSQGNALYLEELIRSVAEGRGDTMPPTVIAMVQARLESLDAEARRVLRAASVFGRVFWTGAVTALLALPQESPSVAAQLGKLAEREVIQRRPESRFPDEEEFVFRSALFEEAAYAMLTDADRTLGHKLAAKWLERLGEHDSVVLAQHHERGGELGAAVVWYVRAVEELLDGNDFEAAIRLADRAIACGAEGDARATLRLLQAEGYQWRGEYRQTERAALEALCTLPKGSPRWCAAIGLVASASSRLGDDEGLLAHADALHETALTPPLDGPFFIAATRVAAALIFTGRYNEARVLLDRITAHAPSFAGDPAVSARVEYVRALSASVTGDLEAHLQLTKAAAASYEKVGDLRNACLQTTSIGHSWTVLGAYTQAETALRDALARADRMGLSSVAASARANLGVALARQGRIEEARKEVESALLTIGLQGDLRLLGGARTYLATILLAEDAVKEAEREAREALTALSGHPPTRCLALGALAEILLAKDDAAGALRAASEAIALLEELGGIEEGDIAVRLVFAQALGASGDLPGARRAILSVRDKVLDLARRIKDTELRRSFVERVLENRRTILLAREWLNESVPPAAV